MKTWLCVGAESVHLAVVACTLLFAASPANAQPLGDASAEPHDRFGWSVARGDFNGDGYQDLAVGVAEENISDLFSTILNAGAVEVIYGAPGGLGSPGRQFWHQDSAGVRDVAQVDEYFGHSLAAGDFNGDGYDDLAVGVLYEDAGNIEGAGAVAVLYGSSAGLSATAPDDQFWHQDSANVEDDAEPDEFLGYSLAAGDFNGDGYADLAIGVPLENIGSSEGAGAVNVLYGSSARLRPRSPDDQFWHQDSAGVEDVAESDDYFGWSLAAGDFNGDGFDDLATGVADFLNGEDLYANGGVIYNAGAVNVIYGSASVGLSATIVPDQIWTQAYIQPPPP